MSAIQRRTKEITVLLYGEDDEVTERKFTLKANSIAKQLAQFELQERARLLGIEMSGEALASEVPLTGGQRAYLASLCPVVVNLCKWPADGGGPLSEAEFWNLDTGEPERVIGEQEKLTDMQAILGNGLQLQAIAGRQILQMLQEAGSKSEQQSPEQD